MGSTSNMPSTFGTTAAMETLMTTANSSSEAECNASFSLLLSTFSGLLMLLLFVFAVAGILFLIIVRRLAHNMDLWLLALFLDLAIWVIGKLIQDLSSSGLCMFTASVMFFAAQGTVFQHLGMAFERTNAILSSKPSSISREKICLYILCTYAIALVIIIIIIAVLGIDADLNRGPNMCREGPTLDLHKAIVTFKASFFLLAAIIMIILTIIAVWKLLRAKFGSRKKMAAIVGFTGLVCAMCWLSLPILVLIRGAENGFVCTSSRIARYFPSLAALAMLLLILLNVWAFRKLLEALKKQLTVTARYIRRHTTVSSS
uniref:BILF1 n=1 Tax=Pongo pygmaeus lymphocryptovirus 1 TaxID=203134 RepID=A0A0A0RYC9_9GAMA|nr:BILF1 [Pongo pygmaeus lymphocryptovirus 1]